MYKIHESGFLDSCSSGVTGCRLQGCRVQVAGCMGDFTRRKRLVAHCGDAQCGLRLGKMKVHEGWSCSCPFSQWQFFPMFPHVAGSNRILALRKNWYGIYSMYYQRFFLHRGASQLDAEKYPSNLIRVMPAKGAERIYGALCKRGSFFICYQEIGSICLKAKQMLFLLAHLRMAPGIIIPLSLAERR